MDQRRDGRSAVWRGAWNEAGALAGLPTRLFAKTTPTLLTRLSSGMTAAGEGRFFRELRGELPIEAPVPVHSAHDRASGRSIHLFEDLVASRKATFCNQHSTISRAQAETSIAGKALLEELLFRAAPRVSEGAAGDGFVEVPLRFRLTRSVDADCIEIVTERAAEGPLVTRLPRPF